MYYVNMEQIEHRLKFITVIVDAIHQLQQRWGDAPLLDALAQERILHLAIESVTDIGTYMIDGLMMREASSYEDIVEILYGEQVFSEKIRDVLLELVQLRRPLVQHYFSFERVEDPHHLIPAILDVLPQFVEKVRLFLADELKDFS